jgi:hypothetical protein
MNTPAPSASANPPPTLPQAEQGDATGGVIPYKNPHALIAYYLGLFSLIPMLGLILGAVALWLGISGLKERKKRPIIRGSVHAWIGIIVGGGSVLVHLLLIVSLCFAAMGRHR